MQILLISYYYPPCNSIASNRVVSIVECLTAAGYKVTVITRGWSGNENTWNTFLNDSPNNEPKKAEIKNGTIIYLPYRSYTPSNNLFIRKFKTLFNLLSGKFNPEVNSLDFYEYIWKNKTELGEFDFLITSAPPLNIVYLGSKIYKLFPNIKWICDFRDLQNHILLSKKPRLNKFQRFEHSIIKYYLKRWLKSAYLCTVASEPFASFLNTLNVKSELVLNGFDINMFNSLDKINTDLFEITVLGTIYPHQEIDFFLSTLELFIKDKDSNRVRVNFIGTNSIPEVASTINKRLDKFCETTDKIPIKQALNIGSRSAVLIYPGWKGYKGMYSGKFFDYLALRRPILIAPSDEDVLERILFNLGNGMAAKTIEEGCSYLNSLYKKWLINPKGLIINKTNVNDLNQYSRQHQNKKFINLIVDGTQ